MRFTVNTPIFKSAIDTVSHASISGSMTPILENILLSVQYKRIVLTANNLEMAIEYSIDTGVQIETEWSFTVSSKFLSSFVSLLSDEQVSISLVGGSSLELVTPSSDTKIRGIDASKFPVIPGFKAENPFVISAVELKRAIEKTLFSTAEWNIRPTLAGIFLAARDSNIVFASTDSFRLSEFILKGAGEGMQFPGIIIPAKTAAELSRILTDEGKAEIFVTENQLLVVYGNVKLYSRLLNGYFPDYRSFFPKGYSTRGVILRSDLIQALRRLNLISRENNYNTRMAFRSESGVELSTGDTEIGAGRIAIPASIEGEDNTVGLNATYLLEALAVIKEDYVSLDFETSLSPIVVRWVPAEDDRQTYRHIIMPLKI